MLGLLRPALSDEGERSAQVEAFLAQPRDQRFVFGTGDIGRTLARAVKAGGFLDDYRAGGVVDGLPVHAPERACGLVVANGVVLGRPRTAAQRIIEAGSTSVDYLAFVNRGLEGISFPGIGDTFRQEFEANRGAYGAIFDRLADDESKDTYIAIINARLHRDIGFLAAYSNRQHEQYFEPFLGLRADGETFADVGSFDGATSRMFAERYPGYRHIHALEPSIELATDVRRNLKDLRDVTVHEFGAGDRDEIVGFTPAGSASRVVEEGGLGQVQIRRLDGLLVPEPSFIKMDIEGQEIPALLGAAALIARARPILAVCCYHKVDDMRTIVSTVNAVCDSYDLYLRHYTEGLDESVYFFLPR